MSENPFRHIDFRGRSLWAVSSKRSVVSSAQCKSRRVVADQHSSLLTAYWPFKNARAFLGKAG